MTVAEFWRRWHMSLSSWFRDYLYIPLGGSKKGLFRRYLNLMIVFLTSGLWHGASWHFVAWGGLNGIFQIIGSILKPVREKIRQWLKIDTGAFSHKLGKTLITFILISFTWIFFRANSLREGIWITRDIFTKWNPWVITTGGLLKLGLDGIYLYVISVCVFVITVVDFLKYRNIKVLDTLLTQGIWLRFLVCILLFAAIIIFGSYGPGYDAASFIYFQF